MQELDMMCAEVFFKEQGKLIPKPVVESVEEAMEFLEEVYACVFNTKEELLEYMDEEGVDYEDGDNITDELEVFVLPDGRLLYVEA